MWFEQMHPEWQLALAAFKPKVNQLEAALIGLPNLVPAKENVMAAFEVAPSQIKVVILGQDPYPTPGLAIGHSFAIGAASKVPGSLRNIAAELKADISAELKDPELRKWREQGVWLLNTCLTTIEKLPGAHAKIGWQELTESALRHLARSQPLVILAWGKPAQQLAERVQTQNTKIVASAHPSPLSAHRGFLGSHPFSKTNLELRNLGLSQIDW